MSQLAMVSDDFAQYWSGDSNIVHHRDIERAQAHGYCVGDDPQLMAEAIVAQFNQFCYLQLSGGAVHAVDNLTIRACIQTLANIYRAIYSKEDSSNWIGRAATPGVISRVVGCELRGVRLPVGTSYGRTTTAWTQTEGGAHRRALPDRLRAPSRRSTWRSAASGFLGWNT